MTKVEQLKARVYAIELFEERIRDLEAQKEYIGEKEIEEKTEWEIKQLTEADDNIRKLEYIIEELAK